MTDAAFSSRMDATTVLDRVAPPRRVRQRVADDFQAAMLRPSPTVDVSRWWTKEKIAAIVFPSSVIVIIIVVWSVMAVREGWLP